jgi:bifunctional DNA-binding transcriptional regulator/antitoxin component of YhaV-PrlF toxin-antitoxin module
MTFSRVRREENDDLVITIPTDIASKTGLHVGDHVQIEAVEDSGKLTITRVPIEPRARHNFREIAHEVIEEHRELLDRLAAYDRGEEP